MNYDPHRHHRRSIRLKGYDYSHAGAYFITICCHNMVCRFGEIVGDVGAGLAPTHLTPAQIDDLENLQSSNIQPSNIKGQPQGIAPVMHLNEFGQIAYDEWAKLPERYPNFELDVFQIMPNHIHGIIVLTDVGEGLAPALLPPAQNDEMGNVASSKIQPSNKKGRPQGTAPTVGDIVGAYKSLVGNGCLTLFKKNNKKMGKFWQRDYYEHIIRDDQSYQTISNYIINNPAKWTDDKFYKQ